MNDNIELQSNEDLLTWAVQNITTWNDAYTHLRSDLCEYPCYSTGAWYKYKGMHWSDPTGGDNGYLPLSSEKFSTKTLQVITKQEWMNAFHKTRLHTKPKATDTDADSSSCKPLQGHVHAKLMAEYAEVAKTNPEPWKEFEYLCGYYKDGEEVDIWEPCLADLCFRAEVKYRRKPTPPKTMNIGGIVVEAWPLGVGDSCTRLHTVRLNCNGYYVRSADAKGKSLAILLSSGKAFSTKEQAQAVADALNKLYNDALVGWKQQ